MRRFNGHVGGVLLALTPLVCAAQPQASPHSACTDLLATANLTVTQARAVAADGSTPRYCYVRGTIPPGIVYHVQLPLPARWNGRFLAWGDGGKDGDLDFADARLAQGYAVANSNMGHDAGAEPGASFGFDNRQAEKDFGYRAVHLTVNAAKTLIREYYGRAADYSYFEGCSTGGREGLMEAQRFPYDFDGISAGAPVNHYQALNAGHTWLLQRVFRNGMAGNLAFDSDGDGTPDDLTKLSVLRDAVLDACDADDGIRDGVIDDPPSCDFDPRRDLKGRMCPNGTDAADCFTPAQLQTIEDFYSGPYDSRGKAVFKGREPGSEAGWAASYVPYSGNSMRPLQLGNVLDHTAFLFYAEDPGVPVPRSKANDLSYVPDKGAVPPEWAWWEFDIDDFTAGRARTMMSITDATDPDLERFLIDNGGKLLLWHGWADPGAPPAPTLDYYRDVVTATYAGNLERARRDARLFMFPGVGHCRGGSGPDRWDALAPLVGWVEQGREPVYVVATHSTDGAVDNERKVCAYPQRARFTGAADAQDPESWIEENFSCR
jgi:hypothetical protein